MPLVLPPARPRMRGGMRPEGPEMRGLPVTLHSATADHLVPILDLIRFGQASTRPEISRVMGLGRTVVTQRVAELIEAGLVVDGTMAESTGGRPSRSLAFNASLGVLLVAELGATAVNAALTNLSGDILERRHEDIDIADGPDIVLGIVERIFDDLVAAHPRPGRLGGRDRTARPGGVQQRLADLAPDHAGLGPLSRARAPVLPLPRPDVDRQRREPAGPRRAPSRDRHRRGGRDLRQDRHRHRCRAHLRGAAASRGAGSRRRHRPRPGHRVDDGGVPVRQGRLPRGARRWPCDRPTGAGRCTC